MLTEAESVKLQPSNSSLSCLGFVPVQDEQDREKRLENTLLQEIFHLLEVTNLFRGWNPLLQCFGLGVAKQHVIFTWPS